MKSVSHVVCNLRMRSCGSEVCCHLGTISWNTSEVAKRAHVATIDKAQHTFAATGIYPYRPNIIFDEYLGPYEIIRKDMTPVESLEGTEDGHWNVGSHTRVEGPDLPTPAPPRTPDNTATARKYPSH
jgi:hypothetical protein